MMKIEFEVNVRRVLMPAACGVVGLFSLHAAYPQLYGFWPSTSQDLAAWVQAVGSVAAIMGSVWIAHFQIEKQAEKERRDALDQRLKRVRLFHLVLRNAHRKFLKISNVANSQGPISVPTAVLMRIEVNGAFTRLSQLDVRDFAESEKLLEALSVAIAVAQALGTELDGYILGMNSGTASFDSLKTTAGISTEHMDACAKAVAEFLELPPRKK